MTSNALATGRRTYLHESAALDFAIRACEALGLVFWALAPGTDIWATDYSQNSFRVTVGKTVGGMRKVSYGTREVGNRTVAYVPVGERRTVAQADQWSLFSIEEQANDVADTADIAIETVAPVADTVESLDAELIATTDKGAREAILARRQMVLADTAPVADTADHDDHIQIDATITDRSGNVSVVYAGSMPAWAWELDRAPEWRKAKRASVLESITSDPRGYRVTFAPTTPAADTADTAPVAPVDHTVSVEKVRMSSGPGWRAVCTCGHASVAYFAEHAADTMAQAHVKETAPKSRDAIEATATAQGWTIEPSIVGDSQSTLTRAGVSLDLEYNVGGNVKRASVYGQTFGTFGYSDRIAEVTPRDTDKRATVLGWLAAPVGATRAESRDLMRDHVADVAVVDTADVAPAAPANTVTIKFRAKLDDFAGGKGYKVPVLTHSHVSVAKRDMLGITFMSSLANQDVTRARLAKFAALTLPGVVFAADPGAWTVTPIGKGFMADISITAPLERTAPVADTADTAPVAPVADTAVAAPPSNDVAVVADVAPSNDVPAETEFAARVRTARAPKVPGIHVARCYRCGERACETLRLPVSSLTNVCSEHVTEARAVALRWDAASRYMHEEAPHIASSGRLAVRFTREATNRLDIPLAVIAETLIGADNTFGDIDTTLAQRLDAFTAARGTAPSNPVVGK